MDKKEFIKGLWCQKEDRYTDFYYYHWEIFENNKNWYCDILIGDVTQIEQTPDWEESDGRRVAGVPINVITKEGIVVAQSYGFTASVNKNPIIGKMRWNMLDQIEGESANFMMRKNKIYKDCDILFIDTYQTRQQATDTMMNKFWELHELFMQSIYILKNHDKVTQNR